MTYRNKVTILGALLGVLTLTAVLGTAFSQRSLTDRQSKEALVAFQAADVAGLEISNGVVLKKAPAWTLTVQGKAYPASADRVDTYLKTLGGALKERLVASGSDGAAFGLAQGFKTLKLLNKDGKALASLDIGGANDLGDKVYVRFQGTKDIWQTDRGFARTLDLDFNTWADLSVFPGKKPTDLTRVAFDSKIETADKTVYSPFDLVKTTKNGKDQWENRLGGASTEAMASWANLVAGFRLTAYADPTAPAPAGTSVGTVTLSWSDGTTTKVTLYPADAQGRYRATDGTHDGFIADWALGQLLYKS